MKILLLNPPKYRLGRYMSRDEGGIGTIPRDFLPSNIFLAATYLKERGKDVDVLDAKTAGISYGGYDVIVVWVCTLHSFYDDIEFLRRAKEEGKRTIMILNDAHDQFELEAMQRFSFIDASIRLWEREVVLDKLISKWEKNQDPDFSGVIYRKDGTLVDNGTMPFLPNLEHLSSTSKVLEEAPLDDYKCAAITTGRGCPRCHTFCLYRMRGLRKRKVKDAVSEFETISTSIERVFIMDPAMTSAQKWMRKFCDELIARKIKISWRTDERAEHCNMETLRKLKSAGCDTLMMGVETLDSEIRKKVMTSVTPEMVESAVKKLRKANITLIPIFYLGFPWDSDETLSKIKGFLRRVPIPSFELAFVKPWRGTPFYEQCKKLGLLERELTIDDYVRSSGLGPWGPGRPMMDTLYLTRDQVVEWRDEIRRSTFSNPEYILNFLLERREIKPSYVKEFLRAVIG